MDSMELDTLSKGGSIIKKSPLAKLNPLIDEDGLLRVGGRLKLADLSSQEKTLSFCLVSIMSPHCSYITIMSEWSTKAALSLREPIEQLEYGS